MGYEAISYKNIFMSLLTKSVSKFSYGIHVLYLFAGQLKKY